MVVNMYFKGLRLFLNPLKLFLAIQKKSKIIIIKIHLHLNKEKYGKFKNR